MPSNTKHNPNKLNDNPFIMNSHLLLALALATTAGLLGACADTARVAQRDSQNPAVQKGDVRPVGVPTTARSTGASQGRTVDSATNNLN